MTLARLIIAVFFGVLALGITLLLGGSVMTCLIAYSLGGSTTFVVLSGMSSAEEAPAIA